MTATVSETTRVDLLAGCAGSHCLAMAGPLEMQLASYTRGAAVMSLDGSYREWRDSHRTARRRASHARNLGYWFMMVDRRKCEYDIYRINTSKAERQGRPMADPYNEPQSFGPNPMVCRNHHVYTYGVLDEDRTTLVAYMWLYRCGQLAMVSSILGHADHLQNDVMYLLYAGMLEAQFDHGGTVFYNLWRSGTDGLRYFKERVGLTEGQVEWTL